MREVELATLESARGEAEIRWLLDDREGYLYTRAGDPIGFAFIGKRGTGPIAALEPSDRHRGWNREALALADSPLFLGRFTIR